MSEGSKPLNDWIAKNSPTIIAGIENAYRIRAMESIISYDEIEPSLDRSRRSLSEMPICDNAWSNLPIPPKCRLVTWERGSVKIHQTSGSVVICDHHAYVRDPNNQVMCVTPGLFEALSERLSPGQRLERLKLKAPELITLLQDRTNHYGIAILYGSEEEISKRFGFFYTEKAE